MSKKGILIQKPNAVPPPVSAKLPGLGIFFYGLLTGAYLLLFAALKILFDTYQHLSSV